MRGSLWMWRVHRRSWHWWRRVVRCTSGRRHVHRWSTVPSLRLMHRGLTIWRGLWWRRRARTGAGWSAACSCEHAFQNGSVNDFVQEKRLK